VKRYVDRLLEKVEKDFEVIREDSVYSYGGDEIIEIPKGATHILTEIDHSDCYYESDTPSVKIFFCKKKK
jgi:hypothetical protein